MSGIRVAPASRSESIRVATAVRLRSGMTNRAIADVLVVGGGLIVADIAPRGAANR